jgi:transposase
MRSPDITQHKLYSYQDLESRIPAKHPLRKLRVLVDGILRTMDEQFTALYSEIGKPAIAPERLLRTNLLQVLYTIRSERQLVQHIEFNLLYRWFVGMNIDEKGFNGTPA